MRFPEVRLFDSTGSVMIRMKVHCRADLDREGGSVARVCNGKGTQHVPRRLKLLWTAAVRVLHTYVSRRSEAVRRGCLRGSSRSSRWGMETETETSHDATLNRSREISTQLSGGRRMQIEIAERSVDLRRRSSLLLPSCFQATDG